MTRREHLLCILMEECQEVAQRASKALRFGLEEIQPGQSLTNAERIVGELSDLVAVGEMMFCEGLIGGVKDAAIDAKKAKVGEFLVYSAKCGTLSGGD